MAELPDLITFEDYAGATGQDPADVDDETRIQVEWAISAASEAVRAYADRDFVLSTDATQGDRQYRYEGYGYLEIDDATSITQVATTPTSFASSRVLDPTEWFATPDSPSPVIDSIELYSRFVTTGRSPEMGFKNNLDNYRLAWYPTVLVVTAVWGWPTIPKRVKQATVWTVAEFTTQDPQFNSEAIAGYSRSFNSGTSRFQPGMTIQSLPDRAAALLDGFTRVTV